MAAAIAAGEEMIFAAERNRPDCAFNRVGIEFDAAIMQEARQNPPSERARSGSLRQACCGRGQGEAAPQARNAALEPPAWRRTDVRQACGPTTVRGRGLR